MISVTYYQIATGQIEQISDVANEDETLTNCPEGCSAILGEHDWRIYHVVDGAAVSRPLVPAMTTSTYDLALLPTDTMLIVTDEEGSITEVIAQDDTLELIDPGTYRIEIKPPFPYLDFTGEVTV